MKVLCLDFKEDSFKDPSELHSFAEVCYGVTPQIALGENWIFLEISKSKKIFSEKSILSFLTKELRRWNLQARIRLAEDIPTSLALCRYPQKNKMDLPIESLVYYLQPFRRTKCFDESLQIFHKLGIRTIKDVLDIPKSELVLRLGKTLALTLRYFDDAAKFPWPLFKPQEEVFEIYQVDENYDLRELEPLLFFLRQPLEKCLSRLRAKDLAISELELSLQLERFSHVTSPFRIFKLSFPFPQQSSSSLLSLIKNQIEQDFDKNPLDSPLREIKLRILKTSPLTQAQPDFFHRKEEEIESMKSLISKLMAQLGKENVFYAKSCNSYLPEKSWVKETLLTKTIDSQPLPTGTRPQRLLKKPLRMVRLGNQLQVGEKVFHPVFEKSVERISTDWWNHEEEREYREIQTKENLKLWAFRKENQEPLFLHGIFD